MKYIKLKSLLSKTIIERAAEFVNNSSPDHVVDLDKEKEKSGESKLMKGELSMNLPPTPFHLDEEDEDHMVDLEKERQVGKPHIINKSVTLKKDYDGIGTDPFVPFN